MKFFICDGNKAYTTPSNTNTNAKTVIRSAINIFSGEAANLEPQSYSL